MQSGPIDRSKRNETKQTLNRIESKTGLVSIDCISIHWQVKVSEQIVSFSLGIMWTNGICVVLMPSIIASDVNDSIPTFWADGIESKRSRKHSMVREAPALYVTFSVPYMKNMAYLQRE